MKPGALLLAAALWATATAAHAADRVVFQNGNELSGTVESQTESEVMLRTGDRVVRIPRDRVREVLLGPRDDAAPRGEAREPAAPAPVPRAEGTAPAEKPSPAPAPAPAASAPVVAAAAAPAAATAKSAGAPASGDPAAEEAPPPPPPDPLLLAKFVKGTPSDRAEAAAQIRAGWPATQPTVAVLLANPDEVVRVAAASILLQPELAGTAAHAPGLLVDPSPFVRCIGIRIARRGRAKDVEPTLITALASDPDAAVKYEALRALEEIGTIECLGEVVTQFEREKDVRKRRRYLRVLRRITGENHPDDAFEAWRNAAERVRRRATQPAGTADPAAPRDVAQPAAPAAPSAEAPAAGADAPAK